MNNEELMNDEYYSFFNPYDHSREFEKSDIENGKLFGLFCYLLGVVGIVVALLGDRESPYVRFHIKQAMKMVILNAMTIIMSTVFSWTIIVPIVGVVSLLVILILRIVAFIQVCNDKAIEPFVIRSIQFLR